MKREVSLQIWKYMNVLIVNTLLVLKKAEERDSHTCSLCGTNVIVKKSDDEQYRKEYIANWILKKGEILKNIESLKKQLVDRQNHFKA